MVSGVVQYARGRCRVDSDVCPGCRAPIRYLVLDGGGRHRSPWAAVAGVAEPRRLRQSF